MDFPKPNQPAPISETVAEVCDGHKVKRRMGRMRACNELNEKGKQCNGHLKRWHGFGMAVAELAGGREAEVYRCERCRTVYLPNVEEMPRTGILSW